MEHEEPSSIIIRMPNWLGDVVMATPVLSALRERFPKAHIVLMISSQLAPLFEKDPRVNEIFAFTRPSGFLRRIEARQIITRIREGKYDLGLLLTNSFSSAWWFYRGQVKKMVGYGRPFLVNNNASFPKNYEKQHLVHSYLQLLEKIGIPFKERRPELFLSREERELAASKMKSLGGQIVIGVNPGAAYGSAKCWPKERFRALAKHLLEDPRILLLFFGDRTAASLIEEITRGLPNRVINMAGRTNLRELVALISACDLFLTNDSGPMHVAAALKVPLLALFGSTSDVMTGPYKEGRVIHKHVACSPCYLRECPLDFRCMKEIEVAEVTKKIREMLDV
jgi:heptosyltransferase-2